MPSPDRPSIGTNNHLVGDNVAHTQHLLLVWLWRICLRMDDHRSNDRRHRGNMINSLEFCHNQKIKLPVHQ